MSREYYRSLIAYDAVPGLAWGYGFRLPSGSSYTGPCCKIRRSSDNTTQDIYFASNVMDETAATSFVGAGNGFIDTLYDWTGNGRHATQTDTTRQPQLISSGSVIKLGGRPTMDFNGSRFLFGSTYYMSAFTIYVIAARRSLVNSSNLTILRKGFTNTVTLEITLRGSSTQTFEGNVSNGTSNVAATDNKSMPGNTLRLINFSYDQSNIKIDVDGDGYITNTQTGTVFNGGTRLRIGSGFTNDSDTSAPANMWNGFISEIYGYDFDNSANKATEEATLKSHYSIP